MDYIDRLVTSGLATKHYRNRDNIKKYPAQRQLFWDSTCPITTKWIIWCDDDTMCDKNRDWLKLLAECIIKHNDKAMFGPIYYHHLSSERAEWIKQANWYKGRSFHDVKQNEPPNGTVIHFCPGSFWCISADAVRAADIPDVRLQNNGGDISNGAALAQCGYGIKQFSQNKSIINWSSVSRRGADEELFGLPGKKKT